MNVALRVTRARHGARERTRGTHAPDDAPLRRTSWRLAALTVGLLCALLLVLGVTLYATMQTVVQDTMRQTLRARVTGDNFFALDQLTHGAIRQGGQGPGPRGQAPPPGPPGPAPSTNGTFCVIVDTALRYVTGADGSPFGRLLPDPAAAGQALHAGRALFSMQVRPSGARYLLYSAPVRAGGRTWGVIQAGLPEEPYLSGLHLLVRTLLPVSALGLVAVGAISIVLVHRALRPIRMAATLSPLQRGGLLYLPGASAASFGPGGKVCLARRPAPRTTWRTSTTS